MSWDTESTPGAACESLPLDVATDLFFPTGDGGLMLRTAGWPKPDSHEDARRVCGPCPVLEQCLRQGLETDGWTFRGGMSPEERAAVGGYREKAARKRRPYLTATQVRARLDDSGMDVEAVADVIAGWHHDLDETPTDRAKTGAVQVPDPWWDQTEHQEEAS